MSPYHLLRMVDALRLIKHASHSLASAWTQTLTRRVVARTAGGEGGAEAATVQLLHCEAGGEIIVGEEQQLEVPHKQQKQNGKGASVEVYAGDCPKVIDHPRACKSHAGVAKNGSLWHRGGSDLATDSQAQGKPWCSHFQPVFSSRQPYKSRAIRTLYLVYHR